MPTADLLGPAAALVLAIAMLSLFYTGKIMPRNTVPREDFDALRAVNATYADKFSQLIDAVKVLSAAIDAHDRGARGRAAEARRERGR